jgi:general secretion pathway protein A
MNQKLLGLYGLKFNPFAPELPTEALLQTGKIDSFCWRIENSLVREGGFALVSGYEKEFIMGSTAAHTVDFHD